MRKSGFAAAALASLFAASLGYAQTVRPYDINRFQPSPAGAEWFASDTLDLRGRFRPAARAFLDFAYRPQQVGTFSGKQSVVDYQLTTHLAASIVAFDRVRIGAGLPIVLAQDGRDVATPMQGSYTGASGSALGDARVSADIRLFGTYRSPFTVAIGGELRLPTGNRDRYAGDGRVRFAPHLKLASENSGVVISANVGYMLRGFEYTFAQTAIGDAVTFGGAIGLRLLDSKLLVGPELFGSVNTSETRGAVGSRNVAIAPVLGAHYTMGDVRLGAAIGGPGFTEASGTAAFRGLLHLEYLPAVAAARAAAPSDRDGDGIVDATDECPNDAGTAALNGCPDRDHDGIADRSDACPDVAGSKNADPKKNGCPLDGDGDGDGVVDDVDACRDVKGIKSDDPKKNGCPPDGDADGIVDDVDACPAVKGVKSDDPKKNGCPPDTDGDGFADPDDACPTEPGVKSEDPKKNGCPAAKIENKQISILEQIKFKTGSADILSDSDGILDGVTKVMKEHAEIKRVRIEGHTDDQGPKTTNKTLSEKRAESVRAALIKRGVDAKRLITQGFGQEKPIDDNKTEEGRKNNRRVEFHIIAK